MGAIMDSAQFSTVCVVLAFILLDILSGLWKALYNKEFSSSAMRNGLFRKVGYVLVLALGLLFENADFITQQIGYIPVFVPLSIYIVVTELASIGENLSEIFPGLADMKAFKALAVIASSSQPKRAVDESADDETVSSSDKESEEAE